MSDFYPQIWYSTVEFQALQRIVFVVFGAMH